MKKAPAEIAEKMRSRALYALTCALRFSFNLILPTLIYSWLEHI